MPLHTIRRDDLTPYLSGQQLLGDDATDAELEAWFAEETNGYADLVADDPNLHARTELSAALNQRHFGSFFQNKSNLTGLIFGPANASEILGIERHFDQWYAIEPGKVFHNPAYYKSPVTFLPVTPKGAINLPDASVDVVLCMSVLHHIANVSFVLSEIARVLKPGGTLFLREPTVTMGEWGTTRPGLTPNERGLPHAWVVNACRAQQLTVVKALPAVFPPLYRLVARFGWQNPSASKAFIPFDNLLSYMFAPLARYARPRWYHKFAPSTILIVARKP